MLIKHFRVDTVRFPDPNRPGHVVFGEELVADDTHSITHEGVDYQADDEGWFDLPHEVGAFYSGRPGWLTPAQVQSELRAGRIAQPAESESDESKPKRRSRTAKSA